jgi:hypothetical protein
MIQQLLRYKQLCWDLASPVETAGPFDLRPICDSGPIIHRHVRRSPDADIKPTWKLNKAAT